MRVVGTSYRPGIRVGGVGRPHGPWFAPGLALRPKAETEFDLQGFSCYRGPSRTAFPQPRIAQPTPSLQSNSIRSPCARVRSIFAAHNPPCARPPFTTNHTRLAFCVVVHGGSDYVPDDAIR